MWQGLLLAPSLYKDRLSRYGDFHYKDKAVVRPSYIYNGNPYTGKTASLYWDTRHSPLVPMCFKSLPNSCVQWYSSYTFQGWSYMCISTIGSSEHHLHPRPCIVLRWFFWVLQHLGWLINFEKSQLTPVQDVQLLGMDFQHLILAFLSSSSGGSRLRPGRGRVETRQRGFQFFGSCLHHAASLVGHSVMYGPDTIKWVGDQQPALATGVLLWGVSVCKTFVPPLSVQTYM